MEQNGAVNCTNCKLRVIVLSIVPVAGTINGAFQKRRLVRVPRYTIRDKCEYRLNLIATKYSFYLLHLVSSRCLICRKFACVPSLLLDASYYAKQSRSRQYHHNRQCVRPRCAMNFLYVILYFLYFLFCRRCLWKLKEKMRFNYYGQC